MIKAISESQLKVIQNNENLSRYLDNLSQGKKATPRSWLFEDKSPEEIRDAWLNRLSVLEHGDTFEKRVFKFDTSQLEKWGPQGEVPPIDQILDEIVLPTFRLNARPNKSNYQWSKEWRRAKATVLNAMQHKRHIRSLYPANLNSVVENMRFRNTLESNSGWPDFKRRNLLEVKSVAIADAANGLWKTYPAIALFRNYNLKTRLVWMFPMSVNLQEGRFFQPLQSAILKGSSKFYAPWVGFEEVRKLITETYAAGKYIYATDFSKTDEHFGWRATRQVFDALAPLFARAEDRDDLYDSLHYMHNIPLLIGPDQEVTGRHGVASGSNWTNFIETVFDELFAYYVSEFLPVEGLYAIGDDMAWVSDSYSDAFPKDAEFFGKEVGQIVNAEKVTAEPDYVKTLQRLFQRGYSRPDGLLRGVYSTLRALKSSVYPEKFHKPKDWSSDKFCARQYMILENCVDHPLFEEFVKFVVPGQRDLIPFAKKSRAELDRILRETRLLPGFNPTYNQERARQSLADFASIRIAAKL